MPRISTDNYDTVASWNGSQDLFVVEQPDGTKVATPAMVKQFIEAGDFTATGEVKDGHGNMLAGMAKSADVNAKIGDLSQTGLTGDSVAAQLGTAGEQIANLSTASLGANVDLKAYSSASNKYTCPSDGYVRMAGWRQMETIVYVNGVDMLRATDASGSQVFMSIFVKKGMQIHYTSTNQNAGVLTFIPFVYGA